MSKITIIEGNSDDKDKVRALMVKGEPGVSPTIETSKTGSVSTVTFTDVEGTHTATINDGEVQFSDLDDFFIYENVMINTNYNNSNFASASKEIVAPNGYEIFTASITNSTARNVATILILDSNLISVNTLSPDISSSSCAVEVRVIYKKILS